LKDRLKDVENMPGGSGSVTELMLKKGNEKY
jgi:hypothetical protein